MNYNEQIEQGSPAWWAYKVCKISGTRFGQIISGRDNMLIDHLANEALDGYCQVDDFENDDIAFGKEHESDAIDLLELQTGIKFYRGGVIASDHYQHIHMASPDGVSTCKGIVAEVKCTQSGAKQINRMRTGIDKPLISQLINYFAVSDTVQEVYWASYCPFRPELELVMYKLTRDTVIERKEYKTKEDVILTVQDKVNEGLKSIGVIDIELQELLTKIRF